MNKKSTIIGVDMGGTKIDIALYDQESMERLESKQLPTQADKSFEHVFSNMIDVIAEYFTDATVGIGIGIPGLVEKDTGTILTMPNIPGAEGFHIKEEVESHFRVSVAVNNDARCFTLAEAHEGAGKGKSVVCGVTIGTGVGGGIVIEGKLYQGAHGFAAEVGHMLLQPGRPPYDTDNMRGDVEQFFSGRALAKRCTQAERPEELLEGETCAFLHDDITQEIAWMCTNLIHLVDPDVIVFGGSAGKALEKHLASIESELDRWLLSETPKPRLSIGKIDDAATRGAALLVQHMF